MSNFEFDGAYLWTIWLAPLVVALGVYGIWQRRRALRVFAPAHLLGRLAPPLGLVRPVARLVLLGMALSALAVAILNPRWGEIETRVARRNVDVLVVLDVSKSMLARDIAPNRLERARLSIRDDLLPALGGDRIGLITFAGIPTVKCPLTTDYGFFRLVLEEVTTASSPRGGTLIGDALRKARDVFKGDKLDSHKVVLLITDGEDQESFPVNAAAALWADCKAPVVAVALGDERDGARIPLESRGEQFMTYKGETVWTRANFSQLRAVAETSDLRAFVPVGTLNFDLGQIYREKVVPALKAREVSATERIPAPSRFHPFAVAALLLLLVESLVRDYARPRAAVEDARRVREEAA